MRRWRDRLSALASVGVGLLLGRSLTTALGGVLLATPATEQIGSTVRLFDPVAYAASLLLIVTACAGATVIPALRAGRIDPSARSDEINHTRVST
jgi:ABC-type antimicrobial peptide transport system permease subunit